MPMYIKNLLHQPLCLHLTGDGARSLHLNPREKREIPSEDISDEICRAEKRGSVTLTDSAERVASPSALRPPTTSGRAQRVSKRGRG